MAYHGKAKSVKWWRSLKYFTRKDNRAWGDYRSWNCSIGKKNKIVYHRKMRRGKNKLSELKGSQWKKLSCCDAYNWI